MNEIEQLILLSLKELLLDSKGMDKSTRTYLAKQISDLLNPPKQQSIAEKTHDVLCESSEVKK